MADEERYRLAPLRDARARDEKGSQHALARALDEARAAAARLDAARAHVTTARAQLDAAIAARDALLASPMAATPAHAVHQAELFIGRHRRALADRQTEALRLEAAAASQAGTLDVARQAMVRARADREIIERHFARWREQRKKQAERRSE